MAWLNGIYFSKREEREIDSFLNAQGLSEAQQQSVKTYLKSSTSGAVYFWTSGCLLGGAILGFGIASYLGAFQKAACVLF